MKLHLISILCALVPCAAISTPSHAAVLSIAGDADCFGLGGSCPDGTLWRDDLGGVFFDNYASPGEAPYTDYWGMPGTQVFSLNYSGGTKTAIEIRVAGINDYTFRPGVYPVVRLNGIVSGRSIGYLVPDGNPNDFQLVKTFKFDVDMFELRPINTVAIVYIVPDGSSVDYVALTGTVSDPAAVPEPATWCMVILGFGATGSAMRRRKLRAAISFD